MLFQRPWVRENPNGSSISVYVFNINSLPVIKWSKYREHVSVVTSWLHFRRSLVSLASVFPLDQGQMRVGWYLFFFLFFSLAGQTRLFVKGSEVWRSGEHWRGCGEATTQLLRVQWQQPGWRYLVLDSIIFFPPQVAFPDSSQNTEALSMVLQDNTVWTIAPLCRELCISLISLSCWCLVSY